MILGEQNPYLRDVPWIDRDDVDISAFVRDYARPMSFDLAEKLRSWREDGYVIFEQVVDHGLIDSFLSDVELIRDKFHEYLISIEVRGRQTWTKAELREAMNSPGVKFNHLHVSSIHAARLSLTREITEFLTAIFGSVAIPMQSLTFCHGSEQATHIDYPYVCRQKRLAYMAASWIPLEDVHQLAGPLAYYPGAHKPSVCGFFDWGNGNILAGREGQTRTGTNFAAWLDQRIASAGIKPKTLLVRKGDLLIWHCNMPHTGTRVQDTSLTRKSYVTHYTGLADYPANWIRPDVYQPSYRTASGVVIDFPWSKAEGKLPSWQQYFSPRPR